MFRYMLTEVVAYGRVEEDKEYRRKVQDILNKYGLTETVWRVEGRRQGLILVEWGTFESREEAERTVSQVDSDDEWIALQAERAESGTIVPGSGEFWVLTEY